MSPKNNISLDVSNNNVDLSGNKATVDEIPKTSSEPQEEPSQINDLVMTGNSKWFEQTEYIIFRSELKATKKNFLVVLKECKENKRLLDLKYDDLNRIVNNIQTSVIFFSTISGFLQATRIQFNMPDSYISVTSITISTYISLLLSISKYYKLDEMKEKIQVLREKFSLLHNDLDYQMDVLGPWMSKNIWIHQNPKKKLENWRKLFANLSSEYDSIIETKKDLVTEFEIIMDTKSRNYYHIKNRELNYSNRIKINEWDVKEGHLEQQIRDNQPVRASISLQHEELDNWDDEHDDDEV